MTVFTWTSFASSCVPLALHAMPATCVSGERLNSRTLELLLLWTYDACAHANQPLRPLYKVGLARVPGAGLAHGDGLDGVGEGGREELVRLAAERSRHLDHHHQRT